eukprot:scaffold89374_cov66-Phaeocystis_antarctica.AAC.1
MSLRHLCTLALGAADLGAQRERDGSVYRPRCVLARLCSLPRLRSVPLRSGSLPKATSGTLELGAQAGHAGVTSCGGRVRAVGERHADDLGEAGHAFRKHRGQQGGKKRPSEKLINSLTSKKRPSATTIPKGTASSIHSRGHRRRAPDAHLVRMHLPGVSNALGRSCAAVVCAALVANSPLNTVLEASTYQPSPEVQQLRFVDVDANNADTQLIFPSELLAAANAPAKPLTPAQRAERAEKEKAAKAAEPTKTAAPPSKVAQSKTEAPKAVVKEEPAKKAAAPSRAERAKAAQTKKADDFWGVEAKAEAAKAAPPAQAERPNPAPKAEKAAEERAMRQARADQEKAAAKATKDAASAKAAAPKAEAPKADSPKAVKAEPVKGAAASKGEDKAAKEATYNAKKEADAKVRAERD